VLEKHHLANQLPLRWVENFIASPLVG
jgi:hypothetical protein